MSVGIRSMNTTSEFQNCYIMKWVIENFSMCIQEISEGLESPPFQEEASHNQKWYMTLFPRGYDDETFIGFELKNEVEVCDVFMLTVSVIDRGGFSQFSKEIATILVNSDHSCLIPKFIKRDDLFKKKISLLPNDVLTLQCVIRKPSKLHCTIQSLNFEKFSFTWPITNFSSREPDESVLVYPLKVNLKYAPKLCLHFGFEINSTGEVDICLNLEETDHDDCDSTFSISYEISAVDSNRFMFASYKGTLISYMEKMHCLPCAKINKLFHGESGKLPNDTLLLLINYQISNGSLELKQQSFTESDYLQPRISSLSDKTLSEKLYEEMKFCDVVLKVGNDCLPAHKAVLHSQSPVFRAMLESDMAEKNTGVINIVDFDMDTIKHLLRFLYTEKLDDTLSCEDILNVDTAARKYKVHISSLLITKMAMDNVQKVVSRAAVYEDIDLKEASTSFTLNHASESLDMLMKTDNSTVHS